MGDRCYMQLTCREKDRGVFEELGFHVESEWDESEFPNCFEMIDYEANYAHGGELPSDVVYFGTHAAGEGYGAESFACDGKTYLEEVTDDDSGFVVMFDDQGDPDPASLAAVKTFITHRNNVRALLAKEREKKGKAGKSQGKEGQASARRTRLAQAPTFNP
jgi:hypothetical protein